MPAPSDPGEFRPTRPHRLLDRLTAVKGRLAFLRRRLGRGEPLTGPQLAAELAQLEQQVDEGVALTRALQEETASAPA